MQEISPIRGRGAQINTSNPFDKYQRSAHLIDFNDGEIPSAPKTKYINVYPKSVVNRVDSPDVPFDWSLNPYQGCEHGCVYCYARNSHTYWGYSAGLDFETKILIKANAPELLEKRLKNKNWTGSPIMLSGNTDCYQPVERTKKITRQLLELFWKHRNPVSIVTKNQLILRDLDILSKMAKHDLVSVALSINTLEDGIRKKLEPRTSSIPNRLRTLKELSKAGVPTSVLAAPIIPSINDHNIIPLVKKVTELGARRVSCLVVRLNGQIAEIFKDWIHISYPDRATKVLNKIKDLHNGQLNNSQYGERMRGQGKIADMIHQQFNVAKKLYMLDDTPFLFNTELYHLHKDTQLSLF